MEQAGSRRWTEEKHRWLAPIPFMSTECARKISVRFAHVLANVATRGACTRKKSQQQNGDVDVHQDADDVDDSGHEWVAHDCRIESHPAK
jgi:hypothetical protein